MTRGRVFCEVKDGKPVRIFKNEKLASVFMLYAPAGTVREMPRIYAVGLIRDQIWERSGGDCEKCGNPVTKNFHLHERIPRGSGGEISLENSMALCASCHEFGPNAEHANRRLKFTKGQS